MAAALKRVGREALTVTRRRCGRGFLYRNAEGRLVRDADERARFAALGIPPAWTEVRIAADPRAHVQAIGLDAAGREQYIYHPDWETRRHQRKLRRLNALTEALPRIRRRVRRDLAAETGSETLALAIAVALIDRTAMRVGREKYLRARGTRGAGTLYARDVVVSGEEVSVRFKSKGGAMAEYRFADRALGEAIARIATLPGRRLLVHHDAEGRVRPVNTAAINRYLREIGGAEISAKDFRTLHASALAGEVLARLAADRPQAAARRAMAEVAREVADFLRNTPLVCRKSYIAPCLFRLFDEGRFAEIWGRQVAGRAGLRVREARLAQVLAAA